jgi:membrane protein
MGLKDKVLAPLNRVRQKQPWLDHLVQAGTRYSAEQGNQLAAAVTYFSFLSLFPLVLLTASVLGFVLHGNPDLQQKIIDGIQGALPGGTGEQLISATTRHAGAIGVVGLLGMLYSGTGWVDNLRTAIRTVWHQNVKAGNIVKTKLLDLFILIGLGLTLGLSVAVTGIGNAATSFVVEHLGLDGVTGMGLLTKVVSILIAMVADVAIFLWLFIRLPRVQTPWRRVLKGAVFAAVGFEILKIVGSYYIARTTSNAQATYGTFGVVIGALVWINLVSRFVIFSAVWTVTAPYDDDVAPSGTADPAIARAAGVPEEFADERSTDAAPNQRQQDKAPTPLTPALQDKPGVGYRDAEKRRRTEDGSAGSGGPERAARDERRPEPARTATANGTRRIATVDPYPSEPGDRGGSSPAGRLPTGALMAGALGFAVLGARSLRGLRRGDS